MQDKTNPDTAALAQQITDRYGLLLSQAQLAELLCRSASGLRYSLRYPSDPSTRDLKACGHKVGRRIYYPSSEVARIILCNGEA
ncbi:MAG: DNA-binding protein [Thiotrichales bacterium]|nr:MAG: DNA-binding protein [Thiotrichales bacterium]